MSEKSVKTAAAYGLPVFSADTPITAESLNKLAEGITSAMQNLETRLSRAGGTINGPLEVAGSLTRAGNAVYDTGNKPTATDVGAVPQKKCTIDLLHLSKDFYYPVVFNNSTNSIVGAMQYDLVRYSHQDGERNPNLYANIILRGVGWGDNGTYFHMNYSITHVPESKLIGKITVPLEDNRFVVYLKGGYSYYLTSTGFRLDTFNTQIIETEMTVEHTHVQPFHVSGATPLEYGVFEAVNQYGFEITGTKYMRLKGTYLTDDGERVYSPNNKPSAADTGAVPGQLYYRGSARKTLVPGNYMIFNPASIVDNTNSLYTSGSFFIFAIVTNGNGKHRLRGMCDGTYIEYTAVEFSVENYEMVHDIFIYKLS